jgi:flagellar export protein FliJ
LLEQIKIIELYIDEKLHEREKKVNELMKRSKETKTFTKLEEKHFEVYKELQNKKDQKVMDEIAIQEFKRE